MPGTGQTLKKFSYDEDEDENYDDDGRRNPMREYQIPHIFYHLLDVKYYFDLFSDSKDMYRISYV